MLAGRPDQHQQSTGEEFPNAAPAAFAVLDRAREAGDCAAQLDLLLLMSADDLPQDGPVRTEAARAERVCPGDPTPGWLLVQYLSQRMLIPPPSADGWRQTLGTATELARRFPGSAAAVSSVGDVHLREGLLQQRDGQPFAARQSFRAAAAAYTRARELGSAEATTGLARALIALREPARAAALLRAATAHVAPSGLVVESLIVAEETAHEFGRAEQSARQLAVRGVAAYPTEPSMFAVPIGYVLHDPERQDPWGPQSTGTTTAERAVRDWLSVRGPDAALPMIRLGEVQFLRNRYDDAAESFAAAVRRTRRTGWNNDLSVNQALLDRGVSLLAAGRQEEGLAVLAGVAAESERGAAYHDADPLQRGFPEWAAVAYHARAQLADAERAAGKLRAAAEHYGAARELLAELAGAEIITLSPEREITELRPERLYANQATADLALDRLSEARADIEAALRVDPMNPAFLMTEGFIAHRAGRTEAAVRADAAALDSDPGAFAAANDLGVELDRQHRHGPAAVALRRAVGARPDYALAWFNLGVVLTKTGPAHALESQGAFARAFRLDQSLQDRPREPTLDERIYRTGLDLSRPLPPRWSLSRLEPAAPAPAAGILALALLAVGLARLAGARVPTSQARTWLESTLDRIERVRWLNRWQNPSWAVGVTAAVFAVPAALHAPDRAASVVLVTAGVVVLVFVAMRARVATARTVGLVARHRTWGPAVVFGVATAVLAPWAPLPVVHTPRSVPRVHAAGPVILALLGVALFLEAAALRLPVLRTLGGAAIVMVASVLVPVPPLDGAELSGARLLAGAGLVGVVLLLGLGVLS